MRAVLAAAAGYAALATAMAIIATFPWGIPFHPTVPIIGAVVCLVLLALIDMARAGRY